MSSSKEDMGLGPIQTSNVYCIQKLFEKRGLGDIISHIGKFSLHPPSSFCMTRKCKKIATDCLIFPPDALFKWVCDKDDNYTLDFQDQHFKSTPEFGMEDGDYYGIFCMGCCELICHHHSQFFGPGMLPIPEWTGGVCKAFNISVYTSPEVVPISKATFKHFMPDAYWQLWPQSSLFHLNLERV